ncbi:MAG: Fe-S biogenesis protein NfuA [Oleiphilaceae bacterium]|uniref:Fe-S biogenesis protein NfuA n=1 Tax=Oleiphilus sp. HI0125 TaxID=1822266 RepID=UPI0007C309E4|nr:Fe-S biogenesis protein NfuA [Oleiphilus sp. HI0125]KZZ55598.1 Fe-S biogenesis protein NfuA [Oleiphilus sp. HI0125]KZZ58581.1 Fe-S biogenesis protein NfuA [Oleiphilus sp. HI0125]MCH2157774.1 Fe-S biogenesis protein NfuA [Oleiphilaceae bacterium]
MVTVSESAQTYLGQLIGRQDEPGMGVRMFVTQPGTKGAETCLAYCKKEDIVPDDTVVELEGFKLYVETKSIPYLEEAFVDYAEEKMGGQLTIKAPNAKMPRVDENSSVEERIRYLLVTDINPGLASHGGEVSLVELTEDNVAVLKFGGGCQGCSAVSITLKDGVEKRLLEVIPELSGVKDSTDHTVTDNAYYK